MADGLPSLPELRVRFIDALHFEDDQGLWEIVWSLNADSTAPVDSKIALARQLVFGLLDEDLVTLRTAEWPRRASDGRDLTTAEVERLKRDDGPWSEPSRASDFVVWVCERERA